MPVNVLIVEDDKATARFLRQALTEASYGVQVACEGQAALTLAQQQNFDLILLDVMLPGLNGFTICRRLREAGVTTLILLVTARDALEDKVEGLDSGADDYLVKPFSVAELLARARALLRRGAASSPLLRVADLTLDPSARRVMRGGKVISLSATEYALLEYMMRNKGKALTHAMLLEHVWQYDFGGRANVLYVYIGYLRRKIDRGASVPLIHTLRGVGFCLDGPDAP